MAVRQRSSAIRQNPANAKTFGHSHTFDVAAMANGWLQLRNLSDPALQRTPARSRAAGVKQRLAQERRPAGSASVIPHIFVFIRISANIESRK